MPDEIFTDPRLTAIYELLNPPAEDTDFYLELAGKEPIRVLEIGHLACALAQRGHMVVGTDPAEAMLAIARARDCGGKVKWLQSDAASLHLPQKFDLIVMTGHVFQVFVTDEEIEVALASFKRHLAENGRLAFETRNPSAKAWQNWTEAKTSTKVNVPEIGLVTVFYDTQRVHGEMVTFETNFIFEDGERLASPSTLRFLTQLGLQWRLRQTGFTSFGWYGNWDRSPITPESPELIIIAK